MTNTEIRERDIFRIAEDRHTRVCAVCKQRVTNNSLAMASHANKHIRNGAAVEVVWYKGAGHDFPVKRYITQVPANA